MVFTTGHHDGFRNSNWHEPDRMRADESLGALGDYRWRRAFWGAPASVFKIARRTIR